MSEKKKFIPGNVLPGYEKIRAECLVKAIRASRGINIPPEGDAQHDYGHSTPAYDQAMLNEGSVESEVTDAERRKLALEGRMGCIKPIEGKPDHMMLCGLNPLPTGFEDLIVQEEVPKSELIHMPSVIKAMHPMLAVAAQAQIDELLNAAGMSGIVSAETFVGTPDDMKELAEEKGMESFDDPDNDEDIREMVGQAVNDALQEPATPKPGDDPSGSQCPFRLGRKNESE